MRTRYVLLRRRTVRDWNICMNRGRLEQSIIFHTLVSEA